MKKTVFLIAFALVGIISLQAKSIYVDNKVATTGNGSLISPYLSIIEANTAAVIGDTIQLRAGTYRESVKIGKTGLTLQPYNNEVVTLNGCDILTSWTQVGTSSVYSTTMAWNISTFQQSNQVFVDGKMLNLTRWPHLTTKLNGEYDRINAPENAKASSVTGTAGAYVFNKATLFNNAATAATWVGAQAWVNLSHNGFDGQGCSGTITNSSTTSFTISGCDGHGITENPWGLGVNTEFYAFNPTSASVNANGGVTALLAEGEWWKDGNTLYVYLPGGAVPSSTANGPNLVEAKARVYTISPTTAAVTMSSTTIKGFKLFATSITTDNNAATRAATGPATSNVIDGLDVKYVTHFTDQSGDWQIGWSAQSGIIVSGSKNIIKNCKFQYSAASAISLLGTSNKVLNNDMLDMNYSVSEAGAINTGKWSCISSNSEIAYNSITNVCEQGSNMRNFNNTNKGTPGIARYHHNKISNFMVRTSDSGGFDSYGNKKGMVRIDHNVFDGATNELAIGIYFDFDTEGIIDHNLFWNVNRPMQFNQNASNGYGAVRVYNNTALSSNAGFAGILNGIENWGPSFDVRNNITTGNLLQGPAGSIITNNLGVTDIAGQSALFNNVAANDYTLKSTATAAIDKGVLLPYTEGSIGAPDLGCFETGVTPWKAGVGNIKPEFALVDSIITIKADPTPKTYSFIVTAAGYCEFPGTNVSLVLGAMPTGVTASLSAATVAINGTVTLTINTNSALTKGGTLTLTGTSGATTFVRTYAFVATPVLTSIVVTPPAASQLQKVNDFVTFKAVAYDQDSKPLDPQPVMSWMLGAGSLGKINTSGKYIVQALSNAESVTATSGAVSGSFSFKVPYSPTAIDEVMNDNFKVYPNPAKSEVIIEIPFDKGGDTSLKIIDFTGRIVYNKSIISLQKEIINVSDLSNGIYLLVTNQGNTQVTKKLVIQKF